MLRDGVDGVVELVRTHDGVPLFSEEVEGDKTGVIGTTPHRLCRRLSMK